MTYPDPKPSYAKLKRDLKILGHGPVLARIQAAYFVVWIRYQRIRHGEDAPKWDPPWMQEARDKVGSTLMVLLATLLIGLTKE